MPRECQPYYYSNISKTAMDVIITELIEDGAIVNGDNPWEVILEDKGIVFNGSWDEEDGTLQVIVVAKRALLPCKAIYQRLEDLISEIRVTA